MPRGRPRKSGNGRRGPRSGATGMSGMIASMQSYRRELAARRDMLDRQLGALDNALLSMGAVAPAGAAVRAAVAGNGRRRGRGPRAGSLKEYILKVLSGAGDTMAVKDITAAVVSTGYRSKNKTLAKSVGIALRGLRGVKKVGRGRFRMACRARSR